MVGALAEAGLLLGGRWATVQECRVDVRARQMARRIDHRHDHETDDGHPNRAQAPPYAAFETTAPQSANTKAKSRETLGNGTTRKGSTSRLLDRASHRQSEPLTPGLSWCFTKSSRRAELRPYPRYLIASVERQDLGWFPATSHNRATKEGGYAPDGAASRSVVPALR